FRSCIRASTAALLLATPSGAILEASLGASELFGYAPGELLSVTREELILPDEAMTRALHERDNTGTVLAEVTGLRKDGAQFPVRWQSSRFAGPGGEPLISVAFTDLSDQKRIEHNARLLDYNLQLVLDNSDEGLVLMDTQYQFITFNKAAETAFRLLHGASPHIGENIFSLLGPNDVVQLQSLFRSVLAGKHHEVRRKHNLPDGSIRVFLTIMRPLFKEGVVIGIILNSKDITRKFQAQEALRLSNERFERAAAASYDIIWEHDLLADRLTLTENFSRLLGYKGSLEMASEEYIMRVVHPDDRALVRSLGLAFVEGHDTHLYYPVHRLLKKEGGFIYAEANAVASRDEGGKAYRLTGVTRDITKQHLMERELRESNRRYELAARASFDLVYEVDLETGAVVYNDVITSFYGFGPGELNSVQNNGKLIHPEDRVLMRQALEAAEAAPNNLLQMPLLRLLKKDGTIVYTELISLIVRNEDGRPVKRIGSARDISWRHAMEQELRKSKERFELAANASYDLIWERDFISESFYYNETFTTFYGYSARELQDPDA
ncbi:MAG: PAS domain S-box protein, partial [Chitinophagaceae bacterium]